MIVQWQNNMIQVNLVLKLEEGYKNSLELSLLKILPLNYRHSHFLAATLISHHFSSRLFGATHFFHCLAVLNRLFYSISKGISHSAFYCNPYLGFNFTFSCGIPLGKRTCYIQMHDINTGSTYMTKPADVKEKFLMHLNECSTS